LPVDGSPRSRVIAEFHDAISGRHAALHDGAWGLANLEVCEAAIASSESGRDVELNHQVSLKQYVSA
jgi:phthalate 4,5-cis-dihydrodiol dehydrogenase